MLVEFIGVSVDKQSNRNSSREIENKIKRNDLSLLIVVSIVRTITVETDIFVEIRSG